MNTCCRQARLWLIALAGFLSVQITWAQPKTDSPAWAHLPVVPANKARAERWVVPERGGLFRLESGSLRSKLARSVKAEPMAARQLGAEIELPMPDGSTARFRIVETEVMAPELAAKFPEIKTYAGEGIDDPAATVRLDLTPAGFHAQILSPRGAVYVDPAYRGDATLHVSYFKRDHRRLADAFSCEVLSPSAASGIEPSSTEALRTLSGGTLRTYRLAVAATGEYTTFHSLPSAPNVAAGQAAIVTAVNRVNGIYEKELAVRLVLISNNNLLVYTSSATDPYDDDNPNNIMLAQNQSNVDAVIGSANYDIGHVFSTGGGGVATLGCVCSSSGKARGVTGLPNPTGDAFWVDFVAHEMGHQFGANHTFNATSGNCGTRSAATAYEPGSGSTIMAYAGICSPNNLQSHSDPYFHAASLDQIQTFLSGSGGGCASNSVTGNGAPVVNAGASYVIPAATPFALTATANDPNGDALTYCWEEMDLGPETSLTDADNGSSPLFRSFVPTNSPTRFFPKLSSVLANTNWNQERLPTTSRPMNFRVTVRDNRSGGGGVADGDVQVTVADTGSPFRVTSPNTALVWSNTHTVTWDVAGTAASPINASGVDIYLSTDGGLTFPHLLVANTPNDGSQSINVQGLASTQARIKIQGAGNIFYDVSDVNFTISTIAPNILTAFTTLLSESCTPTNGAIDPYETVVVNWALTNAGNAPTTNLVATLLSTNGVYLPSASQNYGVIPPGGSATRAFSFIPSAACGGSVTGVVRLVDGAANLGAATRVFNLGASQSTTVTQVFANAGVITINDQAPATPYPSVINISGVTNPVLKVTVTVSGFSHTYPADVDFYLLSASSESCMLMSSCGGGGGLLGVNLTFDDAAAQFVSAGQIVSGTYRPTDRYTNVYNTNLNVIASSPNGSWRLYVDDYGPGDSGTISGGWSIKLITAKAVPTCCSTLPDPTVPTYTSTTWSNGVVRLNWQAVPGPNYQVQFRTNLTAGAWQNLGGLIPGTNSILGITDSVPGVPTRFYRVLVSP